jgi:putative hemin transport protein
MDGKPTAEPAPASHPADLTESIRSWFQQDPSRMTMMGARKFKVPEQVVVEALVRDWPVVRLREGAFREVMEALQGLGLARVFVRSRAAVIEAVGVFGGYSESGPFFNVQTDTLDMHILHAELGDIFAVEKQGHDSSLATYSFQFFDRAGDAAFKAFLWEDFPNVPAHRIEAFRALTRQLAGQPAPVGPASASA